MKSPVLRDLVISKTQKGFSPQRIFEDLEGSVTLDTIKRWRREYKRSGKTQGCHSPGRKRTIRTPALIHKVKQKKGKSSRVLSRELRVSRTSIRRIQVEDLGRFPYKEVFEPKLTDIQKSKRVAFAKKVQRTMSTDDCEHVVFSDEKMFNVNGPQNAQNTRFWACTRQEADAQGATKGRTKFPGSVMVFLAVCSKGCSQPVFFDKTVTADSYCKKGLPIAKRLGNHAFGRYWTFQQDGATAHTAKSTQSWCQDNLPAFFDKDTWPPNSPDINPVDYCVWNEVVTKMKWDRVNSKAELIREIRNTVRRLQHSESITEACKSWRSRLYRVQSTGGDCLH